MHRFFAPRPLALRAALLVVAACAASLFAAPLARAAGITAAAAPSTADYGNTVTVSGVVEPAAADQQVTVALDGADVASAVTDAAGRYSASFAAVAGGSLTVRTADGEVSAPVALTVRPTATIKVLGVDFWQSVKLGVRVAPAGYRGRLQMQVLHRGTVVGKLTVTVGRESFQLRVPLRGVGKFTARATFSDWGGLTGRSYDRPFASGPGPRIKVGSRGPAVRTLLLELARLRFRIPGVSTVMTAAGADSIMAFQKAYRLPRTYVFGANDWRRLDGAVPVRPRYTRPALHIEIDKTRQILMVVKDGSPLGILCVSTGATGNTPEGVHRIMWKAHAAFTPYGNTYLYWDMQFYPGYAMHAYPFVPPYPASHGCVREPVWVAPWTFSQSVVGETVYVYR